MGARDATAQLGRVGIRRRQQFGCPPEGLLDHQSGLRLVEAEVAGSARQLLDQVEDVGGAGPRDGAQRVDLRFRQLDHGTDRLEHAAHERDVGWRGARPGSDPGHAEPDNRWRVGHRPEHDIRDKLLHRGDRHPRGDADHERVGRQRHTDASQQIGHHRGLHADQHDLRASQGGGSRIRIDFESERDDAILAKGRRLRLGAIGDGDPAGFHTGCEQTGQDGTAHRAGTQDGDLRK